MDKVIAAMQIEMKFVWDRGIYRYSNTDECWRVSGKGPIGLKWVDTDKGELIRSRLVATEVRPKWQEAIFSATPPLEAMRVLIAMAAATPRKCRKADRLCIMLIDVARAHFYAKSKRRVFIRLPPEDPRSGEPGICGELERTMYGTLDAAAGWAEDYTGTLVDGGFDKGGASPCDFRHKEKNVNLLVHGDDFFAVGREGDLGHLKKTLEAIYELKTQMIGPHPDDQKSMKVVGQDRQLP
jgi:hypothetical protein